MNNPVLKQYFDTSNYSNNHPCYSACNKKVLGKFKDECAGKIIIEFVGLRPKLYCYEVFERLRCVRKKAKGVNKKVVEKAITFEDYKKCLLNRDLSICKKQTSFKSKDHKISTVTVNKTALNANDDKRFILEDGVNTLAYGHYRLNK